MLRNDELLGRICYLERANRFWKGLTFGLAAALALFLALGTGLGFSLYFRVQNQRIEAEALMNEARQQEAVARRQAEQAAERARQAIDKQNKGE
jgi:uncharacterized protein HemX